MKMDRGSTGSGLTTAKRGKNQQAGNFRRLEPTTLVMLEPPPMGFFPLRQPEFCKMGEGGDFDLSFPTTEQVPATSR